MLKRSKKFVVLDIDTYKQDYILEVLTIIDNTFQKHYKRLFYYLQIDNKRYSLEDIENMCYVSCHTLLLEIECLKKLIDNCIKIKSLR